MVVLTLSLTVHTVRIASDVSYWLKGHGLILTCQSGLCIFKETHIQEIKTQWKDLDNTNCHPCEREKKRKKVQIRLNEHDQGIWHFWFASQRVDPLASLSTAIQCLTRITSNLHPYFWQHRVFLKFSTQNTGSLGISKI